MDDSVQAAMQRWPDVPAVFGWLSLTARGLWQIHPDGGAAQGAPGEAITNTQLIAFINRNYLADDSGRWFFQNGPQRVFVDLALAPHILRLDDAGQGLMSHTGQPVGHVHHWWLDTDGVLLASTDLGAGAVLDRDLARLVDGLTADDGRSLADHLDAGRPPQGSWVWRWPCLPEPAPLSSLAAGEAATQLGFNLAPRPHSG